MGKESANKMRACSNHKKRIPKECPSHSYFPLFNALNAESTDSALLFITCNFALTVKQSCTALNMGYVTDQ